MNTKFTTLQELWNYIEGEARKKIKKGGQKSKPIQPDGGKSIAR